MYATFFAIASGFVEEINNLFENHLTVNVDIFEDDFAIFDKVENREYNINQLLAKDSNGKYVNSINIQNKIRHLYLFASCNEAKYLINIISLIKPIIEDYGSLNGNLKDSCIEKLNGKISLYHKFFQKLQDSILYFSSKANETYPDDITNTIEILKNVRNFSNHENCKANLYLAENYLCNFYESNCRPASELIQNNYIVSDSYASQVLKDDPLIDDIVDIKLMSVLNDVGLNIIKCMLSIKKMGITTSTLGSSNQEAETMDDDDYYYNSD